MAEAFEKYGGIETTKAVDSLQTQVGVRLNYIILPHLFCPACVPTDSLLSFPFSIEKKVINPIVPVDIWFITEWI